MRTLHRTVAAAAATALTATALSAAVLAPATTAAPAPHSAAAQKGHHAGNHGKGHGQKANPSGKTVELSPAGTHETGVFDASAAEIPAFDASTDRLFVVNAENGAVDVLDVDGAAAPTYSSTLEMAGVAAADGSVIPAGSTVNSVAVHGGIMAVSVEAPEKTDLGWVAFFQTSTLAPLGAVRVGALPDSVAFSGGYAVVANEGEPADDFSVDPEGSISVITVPRNAQQFSRLSQDSVRTVDFRAFDEGTKLPEGVRVFGPDVQTPAGQPDAGYIARNLEPEYVTIDPTGRTAYVSVQEANAVAAVDLKSASLKDFWALQLTDWSTEGKFDASNRDSGIELRHWPVLGVPMPDGIDVYHHRGQDLILTANEGDSREWGDYVDTERVKDLTLCEAEYPNAAELQKNENLGRLNVLTDLGWDAERECIAQLHTLGGRGFSVYTADGERLFDSAGLVEQTIADLIAAGELPVEAFNANNDETPSFDSRSDDKGPEPESVVVGKVQGRTYAFLGLERIGGVMVFDITDPTAATFVDYVNERNWDAEEGDEANYGDMGAEGLEFVPASESPSGVALLIVANEVSGSTTVYEVNPTRK
ncbi:Alkaline phosphatase [Micrococcus lylae]|uniref:Alkaline phosphatase n=1 Tax=Micrococcus lylae TaxID=1273 RepID=A0A1R4IAJ9_9MICC|nr:choice-of-anchor I family protein [Micrococcus lylae]SJN16634.1 Alkaline phosphatase [Micrococcus lylae]